MFAKFTKIDFRYCVRVFTKHGTSNTIGSITSTLNILPKRVAQKGSMPDKLGKDGQGVLPRPRDIMMQINFKVMKRSNIRVKQITISQDLTVHCHSTSLEPYNFIKNIWSKISKFQNSSIRAFEPRENSQKFSKALFSSSKLAFWCFENALNSWLLLKMNFWCKKLWFYVSEFALMWWPHIHSMFVLMGP